MTSPRYIVKPRPFPMRRWRVWDTVRKDWFGNKLYTRQRTADKAVDRLNAAVLQQADAYRRAKDNG